MAWRIALACLVLAGVPRGAWANGRSPGTQSITFRQGHESDIVVGLTFGLVVSHDGGKTWGWMCEDAVPYQGKYDPRFVFTPSGALFATTMGGLKVVRDSCTFNMIPATTTFASTAALGPGPGYALYYAAVQAADPGHQIAADYNIYKSTDDGMTFPTKGTPTTTVNWWQSLEVAPGSPLRLYLSGYAYVTGPTGGTVVQPLLFRSDNAGQDWTPLSLTNVTVPDGAVIRIAGIAKDNPDFVYIRVGFDDGSSGDSIYRSIDKGLTWTLINSKTAAIGAFVVRAALNSKGKHDVIVGTQALGAEISHDDGDPGSFVPLTNPPHMNCLVENAVGELWACTQNYGVAASVPSDDAGIMKTTDLVTWTKVLRYQDLTEAVTCPAGTIQKETCAAMWCAVCGQLGCTPSPSYSCPVPTEAPVPPPASKGGCCDSGSGGGGALALGLWVGMVLLRPRRRRGP